MASAPQLGQAIPLPAPPTQDQMTGGIANAYPDAGLPLKTIPEFQVVNAGLPQEGPLLNSNWESSLYAPENPPAGQSSDLSEVAGGQSNSFVPYVYSKVVADRLGISYSQNGKVSISETLESQSVYDSEPINPNFMVSPICTI